MRRPDNGRRIVVPRFIIGKQGALTPPFLYHTDADEAGKYRLKTCCPEGFPASVTLEVCLQSRFRH